jgi:hypothetical protein
MNQAQKTVYEETLKGIGEGIEAMLDAAAEKPDSPTACGRSGHAVHLRHRGV